MARRVFLHVGLPKTGTTFLQTKMWHNRRVLADQGLLYPGLRRMDHFRAWQEINGTPAESRNFRVDVWPALLDEIAAWPGDALISHEFFSLATRKQARRVIEDLTSPRPDGSPAPAGKVQVLVTVRAYALQFAAVWQEALKMGSQETLDEFMAGILSDPPDPEYQRGAWSWKSQDILRVLGNWGRRLPNDQLTVVTVPPPGSPRHLLWDRWCAALGLEDRGFEDQRFANESIGAPQAALLRRVTEQLDDVLEQGNVRHRWLRGYFGHQVLVPQRGPRFGPRPEQVKELLKPSRKAIRGIERRGYQVVGDLDDLLLRRPAGDTHPDDVTTEEMIDVAAVAIEQMIRDHREAVNERDYWRRTANRLQSQLDAERSRRTTARLRGLAGRARRRLRRGRSAEPAPSARYSDDEQDDDEQDENAGFHEAEHEKRGGRS